MPEWVAAKLSYSVRLRNLFGWLSRLLMDADPRVQRRIIAQAEKVVYGARGLDVYEAVEPSSLRRLARRSLAQHLCQRALKGSAVYDTIRWVIFAGAFLPLFVLFVLATYRNGKIPTGTTRPDLVVFFWSERLYKFVGQQAFRGKTYLLYRARKVCFGLEEIRFFLQAIAGCPRMLLYPELLCNFVRWLGYYGYAVKYHRPKEAVVHFFEGTASSSLMTAYLHQKGLRHIDVQHGEIMFSAMFAFCQFDEVRLWGEHFREILLSSRSPADNIKVIGTRYHQDLFSTVRNQDQPRPKRLLIIDPFLYQDQRAYSSMMEKVLLRLDSEWEVRVRRHPAELRKTLGWMEQLQSNPGLLERGIRMEEEPPTVPIEEALGKSRVVLGVASAALIEAWIVGCKVIHVAGGPCRRALMDRYQNSANVFYCDQNSDAQLLDMFLAKPAVLNENERALVNYLTTIQEDVA
jgi:hypothetical protein